MVPGLQFGYRNAVAYGNATQSVAFLDSIDDRSARAGGGGGFVRERFLQCGFGLVGFLVDVLFLGGKFEGFVRRKHDGIMPGRGIGNGVEFESRVEKLQFFDGHVQLFGQQVKGNQALDVDRIGLLVSDPGQFGDDAVFAVVGHDVVHGDECGHIIARLTGHVVAHFPIVAFSA